MRGVQRASEPPMRGEPDWSEVPAAVLCASCGRPDCGGCVDDAGTSGVVAVVAWEREGAFGSRLWATARAATLTPEAFFSTLPDGPILPALRFAVVSELAASSALSATFLALLTLVAPLWLREALVDPALGALVGRALAVSVPGLAALLVVAHAVHGASLALGARTSGARAEMSRALRFGLYAAGWDVVLGPVGALALARAKPSAGALGVLRAAGNLPTRASLAYLAGACGLSGASARPALLASYAGAVVATLGCVAVLVALAFAVVL